MSKIEPVAAFTASGEPRVDAREKMRQAKEAALELVGEYRAKLGELHALADALSNCGAAVPAGIRDSAKRFGLLTVAEDIRILAVVQRGV